MHDNAGFFTRFPEANHTRTSVICNVAAAKARIINAVATGQTRHLDEQLAEWACWRELQSRLEQKEI